MNVRQLIAVSPSKADIPDSPTKQSSGHFHDTSRDVDAPTPRAEAEPGADASNPRNEAEANSESGTDANTPKPDAEAEAIRQNAENKFEVAEKYQDMVGRDVSPAEVPNLVRQLKADGYSVRVEGGKITQIYRRSDKAKASLPVLSVDAHGRISEVSIEERSVSRRDEYAGSTPDKYSPIGQEVLAEMRRNGLIEGDGELLRGNPNDLKLKLPDDTLVRIDENIDMGHIEAAVDFWNREGYKYGARSELMRRFMRRAANYKFQHKSENRSDGANMDATYRRPLDPPLPIPPEINWDTFFD